MSYDTFKSEMVGTRSSACWANSIEAAMGEDVTENSNVYRDTVQQTIHKVLADSRHADVAASPIQQCYGEPAKTTGSENLYLTNESRCSGIAVQAHFFVERVSQPLARRFHPRGTSIRRPSKQQVLQECLVDTTKLYDFIIKDRRFRHRAFRLSNGVLVETE